MNIYGDYGNIICFIKRCNDRNISVEVINITIETAANRLKEVDFIFMGGAQDKQQKIVGKNLNTDKGLYLKEKILSDIPALFICGGYQMMGYHYYAPQEGKINGLGIFNIETVNQEKTQPRCIGNIVAIIINDNPLLKNQKLVGFENHGGRTYLNKGATPLGMVVTGYGNNGKDGTEGIVFHKAIGTYLHGPVLPKNPHLTDYLIKSSLEKKYKEEISLSLLNDDLETQAHQFALKLPVYKKN